MEVVLARVLRILVDALLLMAADFWQRSDKISVSDLYTSWYNHPMQNFAKIGLLAMMFKHLKVVQ